MVRKTFRHPAKIKQIRELAILCLFGSSVAWADDFPGFTMEFLDIYNAGNPNDNTGYGGVDDHYRIAKYEVSRGMIDSYNVSSGGPTILISDMSSRGGNGASQPATGVSWNEAARFVNWLNTSQGYRGAYKFTTSGPNDNIVLWEEGDAGYDPSNRFRNSDAYYFLPSEDEWDKAAYYDPNANGGAGGYWDYATGSDAIPTAVTGGTLSATAVYEQSSSAGPAAIANAGGLSPYGTMAQNGNVWEWGESGVLASNNSAVESRVIRGGDWNFGANNLVSSGRANVAPSGNIGNVGFRVASVPEPSGLLMTSLGVLIMLRTRKRR